MVVTIEKYFEIYVIPSSVLEYKNNVRTFRNTQCLILLLCLFNKCYIINFNAALISVCTDYRNLFDIYFDLIWIGTWRQFNQMLNVLCEC